MVRQDRGVAASDLKCFKFAYCSAETPTSPTANSNAAAFTCLPFYLSSAIFQNFPVQNFVRKLTWYILYHFTSIFLAMESQCFTKIIAALVSNRLQTDVTHSGEFVQCLRRWCQAAGSSQTSLLNVLNSQIPVLGPWSLTARMVLSPPATVPSPGDAAYSISLVAHGGWGKEDFYVTARWMDHNRKKNGVERMLEVSRYHELESPTGSAGDAEEAASTAKCRGLRWSASPPKKKQAPCGKGSKGWSRWHHSRESTHNKFYFSFSYTEDNHEA